LKLNSRYELCSGLRVGSANFNKCKSSTDEAITCIKRSNIEKAKQILSDKIYCSKQSLIQFPEYIDEIEDNSITKSIYTEQKDDTEQSKEDQIYDSIEISILREKFVIKCYESLKIKHQRFIENFIEQCTEIAINWEVN